MLYYLRNKRILLKTFFVHIKSTSLNIVLGPVYTLKISQYVFPIIFNCKEVTTLFILKHCFFNMNNNVFRFTVSSQTLKEEIEYFFFPMVLEKYTSKIFVHKQNITFCSLCWCNFTLGTTIINNNRFNIGIFDCSVV